VAWATRKDRIPNEPVSSAQFQADAARRVTRQMVHAYMAMPEVDQLPVLKLQIGRHRKQSGIRWMGTDWCTRGLPQLPECTRVIGVTVSQQDDGHLGAGNSAQEGSRLARRVHEGGVL